MRMTSRPVTPKADGIKEVEYHYYVSLVAPIPKKRSHFSSST